MLEGKSFYKKRSHLNGQLIRIINFEIYRPSLFSELRQSCKLSRDLGRFPGMTSKRKLFFDQSMFDIQ